MQVNIFFLLTLHFFIATIQIGVIVQVCYTPQARWLSDLFNQVPRWLSDLFNQVPKQCVNIIIHMSAGQLMTATEHW